MPAEDAGFIERAKNLINDETNKEKKERYVKRAHANIQHLISDMAQESKNIERISKANQYDPSKFYKELLEFRRALVEGFPDLHLENTDPTGKVNDPGPMISDGTTVDTKLGSTIGSAIPTVDAAETGDTATTAAEPTAQPDLSTGNLWTNPDPNNPFSSQDPANSPPTTPDSNAKPKDTGAKDKDKDEDEEEEAEDDSDAKVTLDKGPKNEFEGVIDLFNSTAKTIFGRMFEALMKGLSTLYTWVPAFHDAVINLGATVSTTVAAAYHGAKGIALGALALGTSPLLATNATKGIPIYFGESAAKAFEESAKNDGTIPLVFSFLLDPRSAATKANLKNSLPSKILYALTPSGVNHYFKIDPPSSVHESHAALFSKAGEQFTEQQALGRYLAAMREEYAPPNKPTVVMQTPPAPTANNPPASGQPPAAGQQPTTGSTPPSSEDGQPFEVDMADSSKSSANSSSLFSSIAGSMPFFRTRPTPQVPPNPKGPNPPGPPQTPAAGTAAQDQVPLITLTVTPTTNPTTSKNKPSGGG